MRGEALKEIRKACGLSQEQAAEFLGVSRISYLRYEKYGILIPNVVARATEAMTPHSASMAVFLGTVTPKEQRLITRRFNRRKSG